MEIFSRSLVHILRISRNVNVKARTQRDEHGAQNVAVTPPTEETVGNPFRNLITRLLQIRFLFGSLSILHTREEKSLFTSQDLNLFTVGKFIKLVRAITVKKVIFMRK